MFASGPISSFSRVRLIRSRPTTLKRLRPPSAKRPISTARSSTSAWFKHGQSPPRRYFSSSRYRRNQYQHHSPDQAQPNSRAYGGGDPVTVQVVNSRGTFKRMALWAFYTSACIMMSRFIGSRWREVTDSVDEDDDDEHSFAVEKDADENGPATFITLQLPKQLPQRYYKDSDEDWDRFCKFSKNQEAQKQVRQELSDRICNGISKHPALSNRLGTNIRVSRHWLDFKFPDGPPPEFRRFGIEITDQFISLKSQTIPFSHYNQLRHFFWPRALFEASTSSLWMFYRLQVLRVKNATGVELNQVDKLVQHTLKNERDIVSTRSNSEIRKSEADNLNSQKESLEEKIREASNSTRPSASPSETDEHQPAKPPGILSAIWSAIQHPRPILAQSDSRLGSFLSWVPAPPIPPPSVLLQPITTNPELTLGWRFFAQRLMKSWFASRMDMTPKGAFLIMGQIEVTGSRARAKIDVNSAYDPKRRRFEYTISTVKHIWDHQQVARGGP